MLPKEERKEEGFFYKFYIYLAFIHPGIPVSMQYPNSNINYGSHSMHFHIYYYL